MADVEYSAVLHDDQILHVLKIIARAVDELENESNQHFKKIEQIAEKAFNKVGTSGKANMEKIGKSANVSGLQIGLISGITQELTRRFINLAVEGVRALSQIATSGVELNKSLELTQIAVTNVLGGNEAAAQAFMEQVRTLAKRLRTDYVELAALAGTILPQAKDFEATTQILESAIILGKKAGQSATGIRIAIQEALSGPTGLISLQRRLNVPATYIDRIRELAKTMGQTKAVAQVLGEVVQDFGIDLASTTDTFVAKMGIVNAKAQQIQLAFSTPVFEELKNQADAFLKVFDEHEDDLMLVATAFGDLLAHVIGLIGTNLDDFINNIDFEAVAAFADDLRVLADAINLLTGAFGEGSLIGTFFKDLQKGVEDSAKQIRDLTAFIARRQAEAGSMRERGIGLNLGPLTLGTPDQAALEAGERAYQKVLDDFAAAQAEAAEAAEKRTEKTKEGTQADLAAAQATLEHEARLEELAQAEADAAEASQKITEKTRDFITEAQRKALEIQIGTERKRLDNEIKNAEAIEDIWRKHYDDLSDAALDLTRDEEDARRKAVRDEIEIERDAARERLGAETDFRRELQRIRDRFTMAAQEAERNNDAQAFLAAMRQRDQEVTEARRTRNETVQDAVTKAQEQRVALQQQLAFELEDARIANGRKLEDLQIRLQRELEEQAIKAARAEEERQREYQRELEDFSRKERQRLDDLNQSLVKEVEMVRTAERLKREIRVEEARATIAQVQSIMGQLGLRSGTPQQSLGSTLPPPSGRRRQEGGPAEAGRPYIVGERGRELFIPDRRGVVVPNAAIGSQVSNVSTVFNQQRSIAPTFNVAEDMFRNPVVVRRLQNLIMGVLVEAG